MSNINDWRPKERERIKMQMTEVVRQIKDREKLNDLKEKLTKMEIDKVVEAVREDLLDRSRVGIEKYGVTLDKEKLPLRGWLDHAYKECLDQANYLKRAMMEMDGTL